MDYEKANILSAITTRFVTSLENHCFTNYEMCKAIASLIFFKTDESEKECYDIIGTISEMVKELILINNV